MIIYYVFQSRRYVPNGTALVRRIILECHGYKMVPNSIAKNTETKILMWCK